MKLSKREYVIWTVIPLLVVFGISDIVGVISEVVNRPYLMFLLYLPGVFGAIIASLTEEPLKVCMINALALVLGRVHRRGFNQSRRLWIAGLISVAIWALLHVPYMHYGLVEITSTFLQGLTMFYIIYKRRSIFPAVYVHLLWNFLVPFF